jgi:hypothetical protein
MPESMRTPAQVHQSQADQQEAGRGQLAGKVGDWVLKLTK